MTKVTVLEFSDNGEETGVVEKEKVVKNWKEELSPQSFCVTREHATDRAFSIAGYNKNEPGMYRCICCNNALFSSDTKYNSYSGWPSFWNPIAKSNVSYIKDNSFGASRVEVTCSLCDAHLGHIFDDGPEPTGLRYCINMSAMKFVPKVK